MGGLDSQPLNCHGPAMGLESLCISISVNRVHGWAVAATLCIMWEETVHNDSKRKINGGPLKMSDIFMYYDTYHG